MAKVRQASVLTPNVFAIDISCSQYGLKEKGFSTIVCYSRVLMLTQVTVNCTLITASRIYVMYVNVTPRALRYSIAFQVIT